MIESAPLCGDPPPFSIKHHPAPRLWRRVHQAQPSVRRFTTASIFRSPAGGCSAVARPVPRCPCQRTRSSRARSRPPLSVGADSRSAIFSWRVEMLFVPPTWAPPHPGIAVDRCHWRPSVKIKQRPFCNFVDPLAPVTSVSSSDTRGRSATPVRSPSRPRSPGLGRRPRSGTAVKQVDIIRLGRARLIVPAGEAWDSWFDGDGVTDDFITEREQPLAQEREGLQC